MLLISSVSPFYYKIALYFPDWAETDHANILCSNIFFKKKIDKLTYQFSFCIFIIETWNKAAESFHNVE